MRTLVDLSDGQVHALDRQAKKLKVSRAELIRRAVNRLLPQRRSGRNWRSHPAVGTWMDKTDSVAWVRRLRKEWDR